VNVLVPLIAQSKGSPWDPTPAQDYQDVLEEVEDRGRALVPALAKALAELDAKLKLSKDAGGPKDDDEKKQLEAKRTAGKKEIDLLNDIAVVPSSKHHCLTDTSTPARLDAAGVQQCLEFIRTARKEVKDSHPELTPPQRRSEADLQELREQRAKLVDLLNNGPSTPSATVPTYLLPAAIPFCLTTGYSERVDTWRPKMLETCIGALRDEIQASDRERKLNEDAAAAKLKFLAIQSQNVEARGFDLEKDDEAALEKLVKAHDGLTGADKATEKAANEAQQTQLTADIELLKHIAVVPYAGRQCKSDPFSHLKIKDATYIRTCIDAITIDVQEARNRSSRKEVRQLELKLARFQEAGRKVVAVKLAEVKTYQAQLTDKTTTEADKPGITKKVQDAQNEAGVLKGAVVFPDDSDQTEFADYEQWFSRISMGYQYATISNAFTKGFPRVGATIGFHYPREAVPDDSSNWSLHYGLYNIFRIYLTTNAETPTDATKLLAGAASTISASGLSKQPQDDTSGRTGATAQSAASPITRALEFQSEWFWPIWRNDFQQENPRLRTRIGPLLTLGARKADADTFAHHLAYIGLRSARSPDAYVDLLYGRTGGLISRRFEYRGQYTLPKTFTGGTRLAVGAVGNFGANKRRHTTCAKTTDVSCRPNEPDVISFFVSFEIGGTQFGKFFGGS